MIKYLFLRRIKKYIKKYQSPLEFSQSEAAIKSFGNSKGNDINIDDLTTFVNDNSDNSFAEILFDYIDKSGKTDSEIYKAASVDRRVFSKIRCNENYIPKKRTIIAIGMALKLKRQELHKLLSSAGYSLSYSDIFDLIIMYCVENKVYSIAKINIALEHYGMDLFNTED